MHNACVDDLMAILSKSDIPAFQAAYEDRINYLSHNLGKEQSHRKWFEILRGTDGLRSMRFVSIHNIRILYIIINDKAFLLLAFEERQGHRKSEYSNYIKAAFERLGEMEEKS